MFGKFVSLGWFCGTAASMSKYGLRSSAGPVDWCFTELEELIHLIDTDFEHFLEKENLEVDKNNPKAFRDVKYKVSFFHDVKEDLETDYDEIHHKYTRRAQKFMEQYRSKTPMCFIRAVHNEQEVDYIKNNEQYIDDVIKKYNKKHQLVLLVPKCFSLPESEVFKVFQLQIDKYSGSDEDNLKELFDTNTDFIHWCYANSSLKGRCANLYWELKKRIKNRPDKKQQKGNE